MTRLPSVAYAASSAAITDGLPPAVCLLASRLAFAYKQSTGLFASQLSLREGSQDRSHRVVSPGMRATGMTSSGVGWVSTSEALSFLDGEAGPPSAAICESMRTASAAAMAGKSCRIAVRRLPAVSAMRVPS